MARLLDEIGQIADAELVRRLERLVNGDRGLEVQLLVHLAELDERKLYLERGYSSIYVYCVSALRMSGDEAYPRIRAARVGRQFPLVLERLGAGAVHLSGIKLLGPYLTAENHAKLLDRAHGMTKKQIEELVAELDPKPDAPARLRKLPAKRGPVVGQLLASLEPMSQTSGLPGAQPPAPASASAPIVSTASAASAASASGIPAATRADAEPATFALQSPRVCGRTTPLSPGRFKLQVTLGQGAHDKLEQLQELLRHQNPRGDLALIVERALCEMLEREMKRRFAQAKAPKLRVARKRAGSGTGATGDHGKAGGAARPSSSRYIPREVMREVFARDAGRCTFVSTEGLRCTAQGFLEVHHHETPFARGGAQSADNLRLACRAHNSFLAERDYGRDFMKEKLMAAVAHRARSGTSGAVHRR